MPEELSSRNFDILDNRLCCEIASHIYADITKDLDSSKYMKRPPSAVLFANFITINLVSTSIGAIINAYLPFLGSFVSTVLSNIFPAFNKLCSSAVKSIAKAIGITNRGLPRMLFNLTEKELEDFFEEYYGSIMGENFNSEYKKIKNQKIMFNNVFDKFLKYFYILTRNNENITYESIKENLNNFFKTKKNLRTFNSSRVLKNSHRTFYESNRLNPYARRAYNFFMDIKMEECYQRSGEHSSRTANFFRKTFCGIDSRFSLVRKDNATSYSAGLVTSSVTSFTLSSVSQLFIGSNGITGVVKTVISVTRNIITNTIGLVTGNRVKSKIQKKRVEIKRTFIYDLIKKQDLSSIRQVSLEFSRNVLNIGYGIFNKNPNVEIMMKNQPNIFIHIVERIRFCVSRGNILGIPKKETGKEILMKNNMHAFDDINITTDEKTDIERIISLSKTLLDNHGNMNEFLEITKKYEKSYLINLMQQNSIIDRNFHNKFDNGNFVFGTGLNLKPTNSPYVGIYNFRVDELYIKALQIDGIDIKPGYIISIKANNPIEAMKCAGSGKNIMEIITREKKRVKLRENYPLPEQVLLIKNGSEYSDIDIAISKNKKRLTEIERIREEPKTTTRTKVLRNEARKIKKSSSTDTKVSLKAYERKVRKAGEEISSSIPKLIAKRVVRGMRGEATRLA